MIKKHYAERIRVRGLVQGVGFRPTVWNLANDLKLLGAVWNDAEGVLIDAVGDPDQINQLVQSLEKQPPPQAQISLAHFLSPLTLRSRMPSSAFPQNPLNTSHQISISLKTSSNSILIPPHSHTLIII